MADNPKPNLNLPDPDYDRDIAKYLRVYKSSFQQIVDRIVQLSTYGNGSEVTRLQMESILSQISFILRELDVETKAWVEATINQAFTDGQALTILALGDARTMQEAASLAAFSMLSKETIEAIVADTYQDLLLATQNTERKVKSMVREVVGDQMRAKALEATGRVTTSKAIVETLTKKGLSDRVKAEGFIGIVDKKGRKWNLATYADMVVRTKLTQSHIEGTRTEAIERGVDLAIISNNGAKDACRHYEGMVISMNGLTPGYPTYAELRRSNKIFHPNCKHKVTPIRDIWLLPEAVRAKHERQLAALKNN